jgi:hypothetical protein
MTAPTEPARPMSPKSLLLATAGALIVALLVLFAGVIPAEYGYDPLRLGKLTGVSKIWAPREVEMKAGSGALAYAHEYQIPWRTDVIEIPLTSVDGGRAGYELEYKVRMARNGALIYEWEALGAVNADDVYYDFHGHTTPAAPGEVMTVSTYRQSNARLLRGSLVAPFNGIHGWFFQNSSIKPVVIRIRLAGFYELIPPGEAGNEAGVVANVPAAQARPKVDPRLK